MSQLAYVIVKLEFLYIRAVGISKGKKKKLIIMESDKVFVPVVGGALFNEGKLLVIKRADSQGFLPGYWEIPGGKVEWGEDPVEAVKREFLEETGLEVLVGNPYNVWGYEGRKNSGKWGIEIDFIATCKDTSRIKLNPREHSEFKWMGKSDGLEATSDMFKTIKKAFEVHEEVS